MSDNRLAAAFLLPAANEGASLQALLARAGATDVADRPADPDDRSGLVQCRWAGMTCEAFLDEHPGHRLLAIFFFQSAFLELLDDSPEPAPGLLKAFAVACERLEPDAAALVTHLHQADVDQLWKLSGPVLEADARRLAAERFGLLYVSDQLAVYQDDAWYRPDREVVPLEHGLLMFAGTGSKRWW